MFRTSKNRGQKRFDDLRLNHFKRNGKVDLSQKQIKLIEDAKILSLGEKIELLLVSLGNKLTTELYLNVTYTYNSKEKKDRANQDNIEEIETLLKKLPFVYFKDKLIMKNRNTNRVEEFEWFQVSVNEAVSHFMKKYPDDLTELEEGVLYGYPISAIRAFSRLTTEKHDMPNPATNFLAGWSSEDFWEDEQEYYHLWWRRLKKISPKIVKEAENKFKKESSKNG